MLKAGNNFFWLSVSACLLLTAGMIYLLYRPPFWTQLNPLLSTASAPAWLYYQLPDGLWTAAFAAALIPFVQPAKALYWVWWPAACLCLLEVLQAYKLIGGTADSSDGAWAIAGSFSIFILLRLSRKWKIFSKE